MKRRELVAPGPFSAEIAVDIETPSPGLYSYDGMRLLASQRSIEEAYAQAIRDGVPKETAAQTSLEARIREKVKAQRWR